MFRFIFFAISASIAASIFWSVLPFGIAFGLDRIFGFGLEALTSTSTFRWFGFACVATIAPLSVISAVRGSRFMFFQHTDGRPALFGSAGNGRRAALAYKRRTIVSLLLSIGFVTVASFIAWKAAGAGVATTPAIAVLYCSLATVVFALTAIEFNDLRRSANRFAL